MHPMKLAATALLAINSTAAFAGWVNLGGNERLTLYYEPLATKASGSAVVWVMYDYKSEQVSPVSGRRYRSQKGQQEVDCVGSQSRTVFYTWHSGQMGDGPVAYTGTKPTPWEPNSPNSISRVLANAVCSSK